MSAAKSKEEIFNVPCKSPEGEELSQLSVAASKLDARVRYALLKEAAKMYSANRRRGTHGTKTRAEVSGSHRKLWRQKGTGRARCGNRTNPLWRGGGVTFGPHPRDYSYRINKKQRRLALRSALYSKFLSGQVVVLDGLSLDAPRTKSVAEALRAVGVEGSCLIGTAQVDRNLVLSARNIPRVKVRVLSDVNAEDVLLAKHLVLTPEAFKRLSEPDSVKKGASKKDIEAPEDTN